MFVVERPLDQLHRLADLLRHIIWDLGQVMVVERLTVLKRVHPSVVDRRRVDLDAVLPHEVLDVRVRR